MWLHQSMSRQPHNWSGVVLGRPRHSSYNLEGCFQLIPYPQWHRDSLQISRQACHPGTVRICIVTPPPHALATSAFLCDCTAAAALTASASELTSTGTDGPMVEARYAVRTNLTKPPLIASGFTESRAPTGNIHGAQGVSSANQRGHLCLVKSLNSSTACGTTLAA